MSLTEKDPIRIRLAGKGGQGIMLGGAILAEAAMLDGLRVAETQEYGPEARLGATKADLIISTRQIAFPEVHKADFLLCLSRPAYLRYAHSVADNGIMIAEAALREEMGDSSGVAYLPLRSRALSLGSDLYTNIIGLGALAAFSEVVTKESLQSSIRSRVKEETVEQNFAALQVGYELSLDLESALAGGSTGRG